jgi:hypothetical protein
MAAVCTPHPDGVDVSKQQAPNNHYVHVHDPTPCIDLRFVTIVYPFALNRYCVILHMSFYVSNKQIIDIRFPPNRSLSQQFFYLFVAYFAIALLLLNGLIIEAGCSSIVLFVCSICG